MKKLLKIALVYLCLFVAVISFWVTSSAQTDSYLQIKSSCQDFSTGEYAYLNQDKIHFLPEETVSFTYLVNTEKSISNIDYTESGLQVSNIAINKNRNGVTCEVNCDTNLDDNLLAIKFILNDSSEIPAFLYLYNTDYGTFISSFSSDDAREKYYTYALSKNILTEYECQELRNEQISTSENTLESIIDITTSISGTQSNAITSDDENESITVYGHLEWEDDNGNNHDLRYVNVAIVDKYSISTHTLCEGYTDNNGDYCLTFPSEEEYGIDVALRIYANTPAGNVYIGQSYTPSFYDESILDELLTQTNILISKEFDMTCDYGRRLQISQAILTAYDFSRNMMGENPLPVYVHYPDSDHAYYRELTTSIHITGNIGINPKLYAYSSWDLIMHEYGHHLQYQLGITDSPGGDHNSMYNNADITKDGELIRTKSDAVRLTWGESWPTVFAFVAQQHQKEYLTDVKYVCESEYNAYNFPHSGRYDVDNASTLLGEACERSVMGVLWDIYDNCQISAWGAILDDDDGISLGYSSFWDITTAYGAVTFSDFVEDFYNKYPSEILDLGEILTHYKMASSAPALSSEISLSSTPVFMWYAQGGSTYYPNNQFQLVIYNSNFIEILRTPLTSSTTYSLTEEEWNKVLYSDGNSFYVTVAAYQTSHPLTGEYISEAILLTKPTAPDITGYYILTNNTAYNEYIYSLLPGQAIEITLDIRFTNSWLIQTFGNKDVKMSLYQSSNSSLLWHEDDDDGYSLNALINVDLEKNKTYRLRVEMYNSLAAGSFKLTITPTRFYTSPSSAYIQTYEQILKLEERDGATMGFIFSKPNTAVFTYTPSESGTYTVTVSSSSFYCDIYVIDPRSAETIVHGEDYQMSYGGNRNVTLDIELDAGITYLIIPSSSAPSLLQGSQMGVVSVVKKED